MAMQLFEEVKVEPVSTATLQEKLSENVLNQPTIISAIMNGTVLGMFTVGSITDGDARVEIDGTNQRILICDDAGDARVLIGEDGT